MNEEELKNNQMEIDYTDRTYMRLPNGKIVKLPTWKVAEFESSLELYQNGKLQDGKMKELLDALMK